MTHTDFCLQNLFPLWEDQMRQQTNINQISLTNKGKKKQNMSIILREI